MIIAAVVLGMFALPDVFGASDCDDPRCYAQLKTSRSSPIDGLQFNLDSPSIFIDRDPNVCENFAASSGWMIANKHVDKVGVDWFEAGVTSGFIKDVGCTSKLTTYHGVNTATQVGSLYLEQRIPNGRVDPGDDVHIRIQRFTDDRNQLLSFVTTPDRSSPIPNARLSFDPRNVYYADFGIEGTVSAVDEYSTIPMSKFTNMRIMQGNSWKSIPSSATVDTPDTHEGYMGQKCSHNSFVAGTSTSLNCGVIATVNARPFLPDTKTVRIHTNSPTTITLDGEDGDKDYLIFKLTGLAKNGATTPGSLGQRITNTDGDSAALIYRPSSNPPKSDTLKYTITDGRYGHTREGLISIVGQTSILPVPDRVDDFVHTIDGTTIRFTWSHPDDGGSEITHYKVESSYNTERWTTHGLYSETVTSFVYERHEGFEHYFRIFAFNKNGVSASSDIAYVYIPDTTPPVIYIQNPSNGATITTSDIKVSGNVQEPQDTEIENFQIRLDGTIISDPIDIIKRSSFLTLYETTLTKVKNGAHAITVSASNVDGPSASKSISIIVDAPIPKTVDLFHDDFEDDMSSWLLADEDDEFWEIRNSPSVVVPNSAPENKVAGARNCDNICTMTMLDRVDLTQMDDPKLSFYRYVSTNADIPTMEGIIAYTSTDDGDTWTVLERFTADISKDDGKWHLEEYDLDGYSASAEFKVRFEGVSSSTSENTELDNVSIFDASIDVTPPIITLTGDNPQTIEAGVGYLELGATTSDNSAVIINSTDFEDAVGSYRILYDSTDVTGNKAIQKVRTVNVADTIPPVIVAPFDIIKEATAPLTAVDLGRAVVTDEDPNPIIINDAPSGFPVGTTIITWTATDQSENNSTDTQKITIQDTTKPSFFDLPSSFTHTAASPDGAIVTFDLPSVSDIADLDIPVTSSHMSGDLFPAGDTIVTFTAGDDSGNVITHNITITVHVQTAIQNFVLVPTRNSITASWDQFNLDSEYKVRMFPEGKRPQSFLFVYNYTSHTFTGLKPDTAYWITVHVEGDRQTIAKKLIRTLATTGEEPTGITLREPISDITIMHTEVKRTFAIFESEDSEISFKVLAGSNVASIKDKGDGVITIIIDPKRAHIGSHEVIIGATAGQKSAIAIFSVTVLDADTR